MRDNNARNTKCSQAICKCSKDSGCSLTDGLIECDYKGTKVMCPFKG